jgi:hypothetical protein
MHQRGRRASSPTGGWGMAEVALQQSDPGVLYLRVCPLLNGVRQQSHDIASGGWLPNGTTPQVRRTRFVPPARPSRHRLDRHREPNRSTVRCLVSTGRLTHDHNEPAALPIWRGTTHQCTPGSNRTARLIGRGTRREAAARVGRFGRRDGERLVDGSALATPRAASESG